jgi:hypothetical protein
LLAKEFRGVCGAGVIYVRRYASFFTALTPNRPNTRLGQSGFNPQNCLSRNQVEGTQVKLPGLSLTALEGKRFTVAANKANSPEDGSMISFTIGGICDPSPGPC